MAYRLSYDLITVDGSQQYEITLNTLYMCVSAIKLLCNYCTIKNTNITSIK